jgi:hypothetical protein
MTQDMKQGLVLGVAFAALVAIMPSKAEEKDMIPDDQICEKSIRYSMEYMPEEDDAKLHQARWNILVGTRTDDLQKMVGITMFELGQRLGYAFDPTEETDHGLMGSDEWWNGMLTEFDSRCEELLEGLRRDYGYGNASGIESANPEEAW